MTYDLGDQYDIGNSPLLTSGRRHRKKTGYITEEKWNPEEGTGGPCTVQLIVCLCYETPVEFTAFLLGTDRDSRPRGRSGINSTCLCGLTMSQPRANGDAPAKLTGSRVARLAC